jgi:hypothetical protein
MSSKARITTTSPGRRSVMLQGEVEAKTLPKVAPSVVKSSWLGR